MKFLKIIIFLLFLVFTKIQAQNINNLISPSFSLTNEFEGIINENITPNEVLTSKDIKLIGVENIPDLLKYINGVNIYKVNNSSGEFSLRGIPGFYRVQPLILIDGMEISQSIYDKTFYYSFPITIDDIEKIEVITDPTKFVNGLEAPGGIINIVTKKPELLDANYLNLYTGNDRLLNSSFSINRFYKRTYYKITGNIKKIDKKNSHKRAISKKYLSISTTNFFENSKIFTKFSYMNIDFNYRDFYRFLINNRKLYGISVDYKFKNENLYNFLINYETTSTDVNFYTQIMEGKIGHSRLSNFYSAYYKFSAKKLLHFKSIYLTPGIIISKTKSRISSQGNGIRECFIGYVNSEYNFFKNFKISLFLKNERARDLGNEFSFKSSISYFKNDLKLKLGYSKNYRNPSFLMQYYKLNQTFNFLNYKIYGESHPDKNFKGEKFYSTYFFIGKKINNLILQGEIFYNRIKDIHRTYGKINFFPPRLDVYFRNRLTFVIHGISFNAKYKLNNHIKANIYTFIQHFKNKTENIQGNWLIPKYKFSSEVFFNYPILSGSMRFSYIPKIHEKCTKNTDYISDLDLTIEKYFLKKKIETSLSIQNLLNDKGKESSYGYNISRTFLFKLKYNF